VKKKIEQKMSDWEKLKVELDNLNRSGADGTRYAATYHKLVREAYFIGARGESVTTTLLELIVAAKLGRFPLKRIASVEELREIVQRDLAQLMPTTFKEPEKRNYVIIDVADSRPSNWRPFRTGLSQVNAKKKIDRATALLYVFSAVVEGVEYFKVGFTTEPGTYMSKNRYAVMITYIGEFQIKAWGRLHEVLLAAFLGASFNGSEWYVGQREKLTQFLDAVKVNATFVSAPQTDMVNVSDFPIAFEQRAGATLGDHLSLYRLRYRGAIYALTEDNIGDSIGFIVDPAKKARSAAAQRVPALVAQPSPQ
jgi:hypothetical protein